ncbi:hypothetical protein C2S51_024687 [Perilla frutescens var. frutescens]|nr:hypothetical protein C2S51_024687 [Perilla frutescens var. frutescens]
MAKRELSSTLKNLKFMQRAVQKEEKSKKEEEVVPAGDFPASTVVKRCVVIVEGDPHPGATRGRMSFQSFNPSIDKLDEEASSPGENESAATSSGRQNESIRENGSPLYRSENMDLDASSNDANGNHKRKQKQHEADAEPEHPHKSRKSDEDNQDSNTARSRSSQKLNKREKLDWNVLLPPKHKSKKR